MGEGDFVRGTEPFRRELLAYCYRMLGSVHDAEDLVQETYLRAWRSYDGFEGRASLRSWLYRIATNACLTALDRRQRRELPSGLAGPSADPHAAPEPAGPEVAWLQPIPDALVTPETDDPAAIVAVRESIRLALIASLQYLPPRQRAVLILREVLAFPANDVAVMLQTTPAAVKSALQRARATLDRVDEGADLVEPTNPQARALLQEYIAAFENSDPAALERVLRQDATLEAVPFTTWFAGRDTCLPFLVDQVMGSPGDWRLSATSANGQPAAVVHHLDRPYGVLVLTVTPTGVARVNAFGDPSLVATFDLSVDQLQGLG
ncbi:sigma-70 family RNA polymerase sigma factor [Kibdelosporangium persicum]|uniref:RNA polymerase sigma factor n=1 Tax=Kibdelosporangium persicum TaxID=2698649 RepID=A0ABX2F086_9PSEU|nr:sigma-70 family RNA polymerase sigma factor [Kibdelosporangium persicum]NRN64705.1 RNA polymerase sigma factor [Kibdelosporangium persicum]